MPSQVLAPQDPGRPPARPGPARRGEHLVHPGPGGAPGRRATPCTSGWSRPPAGPCRCSSGSSGSTRPRRVPAADRHRDRHRVGDAGLLPGPPRPAWTCLPRGWRSGSGTGRPTCPRSSGELSRLARGKFVQDYPLAAQAVNTEHSIHLQAVALWLVAALLAVIGLLVLGQLLARMSFLDSVEYGTLRALGISRRTLLAIGLLRGRRDRRRRGGGGVPGRAGRFPAAAGRPGPDRRALSRGACRWPGLRPRRLAAAVLVTVAATAWPTWRAAGATWPPVRPAPAGAAGRRKPQFSARLTAGTQVGHRACWASGWPCSPARAGPRCRCAAPWPVRWWAWPRSPGPWSSRPAWGTCWPRPRLYGVTWDAYVSNTQQRGDRRGGPQPGRPVPAWPHGRPGTRGAR